MPEGSGQHKSRSTKVGGQLRGDIGEHTRQKKEGNVIKALLHWAVVWRPQRRALRYGGHGVHGLTTTPHTLAVSIFQP